MDEILEGCDCGRRDAAGSGCGRGAVLLPRRSGCPRRAVGIDLWRADQTDNSPTATMTNARLEDVADRVEVRTADMTALPFDDESFDVVVSSLAIHNIPTGKAAAWPCSKRCACCAQAAGWHRGPVGNPSAWPAVARARLGRCAATQPGMAHVVRRSVGRTHLVIATKRVHPEPMNRNEITEQIVAARLKRVCPGRNSPTRSANRGLDHLGAAGSAADPAELGKVLVEMLASTSRWCRAGGRPMRGGLPAVPTDRPSTASTKPAGLRPAIKELIHEQFGDGIMSAINFSVDVQKKPIRRAIGSRDIRREILPYEWVAAES
ncbi:methyltransferase domain protein [Mycobacterium xenopi 4042]|uniref:Methyltransferase domain protein n=1 Tax=Mycobacterium xenopi 4042 TaxID=1299334 RepID=X8BIB8_MYCXE|nr:methyltransferase domain protein [Mycobacterium xenopi 4042]